MTSTPSKLKFLITSRPYDDLIASFGKFPTTATYLRFDGDDKSGQIGEEINLVIDARMHDIARNFTAQGRDAISERLKNMQHRTYLWLHLIFDIIECSPCEYGRQSDVERLLSKLPSRVSDAYEEILGRSKNQDHTEILLQIVLAAARPLTLDEVNVAFTSALQNSAYTSHTALEGGLWPKDGFRDIVTNRCGLFLSVYDSKLSFIHQTAREFLVDHENRIDPENRKTWQGRLSTAKSHNTMSLICVRYLLLPDIRKAHPFLPYAANYWPSHYVSQEADAASRFRKDARMLCKLDTHQARTWINSHFGLLDQQLEGWTDLILASYLGVNLVAEDILLEVGIDAGIQNGDCGTTLQEALINAQDNQGQTPLLWAAQEGHEAVVRLLLATGKADIDTKDRQYGRTPLSWAAQEGHEAVVRLLLATGKADIDTKDRRYGRTPLSWAAQEGHEAVVRLLLATGKAGIDTKDRRYGRTPLSWAAVRGHEAVVRLLLATGKADIDTKDGQYGQTPLSWAAEKGHEAVVRLLLATGKAGIDTKDINGRTPLSWAAAWGHEAVVRLLESYAQPSSNMSA